MNDIKTNVSEQLEFAMAQLVFSGYDLNNLKQAPDPDVEVGAYHFSGHLLLFGANHEGSVVDNASAIDYVLDNDGEPVTERSRRAIGVYSKRDLVQLGADALETYGPTNNWAMYIFGYGDEGQPDFATASAGVERAKVLEIRYFSSE